VTPRGALRSGRTLALAAVVLALLAYGAFSEHLFDLPSGLDVVFQSIVVLPAFASSIWLGLPFARRRSVHLLVAGVVAGLLAVACTSLDLYSGANVAKLACYALLGFWFLSLFEEAWWLTLVAILVPWVDIWSVAAGPTRYVVEEEPGIFDRVSVAFPNPGEDMSVNVGPPDILFFALFLAAADRFRLRVAWTWVAMTAFLALTLVAVWTWDDVSGLPALPAVCLGFLVPNADLLWADGREAWRSRRETADAE
jgi:hypothetical protein